jgi:HlyD family secretion protein
MMFDKARKFAYAHRLHILLAAALLATALGAYGVWNRSTLFGSKSDTAPIVVSGNIEAHESVLSVSQVQAPIVYLPFDEGARVSQGTVLARLDDRLYLQQTEIDRTDLQVDIAQTKASESSLEAAQHSVVSDQFDLTEKKVDYGRAETLARQDAMSMQQRDLAFTAERQSGATLAHDQAMVAVARDNITLAQANLAAADAKLKLDEVMLSYTVLKAPFDGVIAVRQAELGQLAGPGVAIFTIDELDHVWLRAYVNETDIGKVRLGELVNVTTDTYPDKTYRGRISFISPQAEFTPKTVETHAERVTLVYRIRIDIDNPTHELLPGMPADASIAKLAPGK